MSTEANCTACAVEAANAKWNDTLKAQAAEDAAAGYEPDDDCDSLNSEEEEWELNWWEIRPPQIIAIVKLYDRDPLDGGRCLEYYTPYIMKAYYAERALFRDAAADAAAYRY